MELGGIVPFPGFESPCEAWGIVLFPCCYSQYGAWEYCPIPRLLLTILSRTVERNQGNNSWCGGKPLGMYETKLKCILSLSLSLPLSLSLSPSLPPSLSLSLSLSLSSSEQVIFVVRRHGYHHHRHNTLPSNPFSPTHIPTLGRSPSGRGLARLLARGRGSMRAHARRLLHHPHVLLYLTLDTKEDDPADKVIIYLSLSLYHTIPNCPDSSYKFPRPSVHG